ncbi:MAG: hypothetical protein Q8907_16635 [Bacteroidota bacterium]|nr:hypothetical protein [Bacteroidota bacterium]
MAELDRAHGIKLVLCPLLQVFDYPWKPGLHSAEKIITLNAAIKKYKKNNLIYLDYFSSLVDERKGMKAEYSGDGVHPNAAG